MFSIYLGAKQRIGVDGMLYPMSNHAIELLGFDETGIESIINELTDVLVDQTTM